MGWQPDQTDWETTEIGNPARTSAVAHRLGLGGPTATLDSNTLRFAGYEGVVTGNWLARAEYRYSDLGTFKSSYFLNTNTDEVFATTRLRTSAVTIGLAYKFDGH